MFVRCICSVILYGRQIARNPATWARSQRKWNISALQYLDHLVGIDDLSDVWNISCLNYCCALWLVCPIHWVVGTPLANHRQFPILYFCNLSLCCIIITFLRNAHRRVFSPPCFRHLFPAIVQSSIFSCFFPNVWNLTNLYFLLLESTQVVTERLRILVHVLFPNFGNYVKKVLR